MTDASHPAVDRVAAALAEQGLSREIVWFDDAVTTAQLAADALGVEVGQIANSLVFTLDDEPILVLTSGAHRVDTEWLGAELGGRHRPCLEGDREGGDRPGHRRGRARRTPCPGAHDRRRGPRRSTPWCGRPRATRRRSSRRRSTSSCASRAALRARSSRRSRRPRDLGSRGLAAPRRPARAPAADERRPRPGARLAEPARGDPLAAAHHRRPRGVPHGVARQRRRPRPAHRGGRARRGRRRHRLARRARRHGPVRRRRLARGRGAARLPHRSRARRQRATRPTIARALLDLAFAELGLHRVTAGCFADNVASWRVMEKLGMRREQHGVRDSWHAELGWIDGYTYGILAEEFAPTS